MESPVLPNALIDVMILIGMDDNTGLQHQTKPDGDDLSTIMFESEFDPQVLSVISATDMVNYFPFPHKDTNYPPDYGKDSLEPSVEMEKQKERLMSVFSPLSKNKFMQSYSPKKSVRSVSVNPKMLVRAKSIRHSAKATLTVIPEMPINDEVLRSIPSFCFPDGMKVYRTRPENQTHFLVLTDMSGNKSYTCCLTFYRPFVVERDDQGNFYLTFDSGGAGKHQSVDEDKVLCYIPQCCITISQFPYYTKMKECLSGMVNCVERDPEEMIVFVKEYAYICTHVPVPPPGNVAVEFDLYQMPVTLVPSSHPDRPVLDLPLHLIFLCFSVDEFLKILACVLMEERIVFLSSNYALLTFIMESIRNLILPFKWRLTYVTVLPSNGLDYLQAPGTFMFGCHSRHKYEVEQVEGLVLVDIDHGTVTVTPDPMSEVKTIPNIPYEAAKVFVEKCSPLKLQFDLLDIERPFIYNLDQLRQFRIRKCDERNNAIIYASLELMVNLFRGVVYKLRVEHNHFNREQFLSQQDTQADKEFYKRVFKTDMFKIFLEERMSEKSDFWSEYEMKTRGLGLSKSIQGGSNSKRKAQTISYIAPEETRTITTFVLPDVTNMQTYIKNSITSLTKVIKECPDYDDRTSYIHLRSLYHLASTNKMAAIDDFISLTTSNIRILPTKVLEFMHGQMTTDELRDMKRKSGHEVLLTIMEAADPDDTQTEHGIHKIRMDPVSIPDRNLKYEEFVDYVSLLEMTNDFDTIHNLFEALTAGNNRQTYVEQITFQMCVDYWADNQHQCNQVKISSGHLDENETILKVSTLIKSDYGIGRVALTDKRMFFQQDGSGAYKEIAKLRHITSIEKTEKSSVLFRASPVIILHITHNDVDDKPNNPKRRDSSKRRESWPHFKVSASSSSLDNDQDRTFTLHLKEERNWWYMVIHEIWAGKIVSDATRDINAVHQALQNTLLIDAVIASGQQECCEHHNDVEGAAMCLSYYTKYMNSARHVLPPDTKKALQNKIDPNTEERERKAVQALLYASSAEGNLSPRLWCGLSDGKIKVYNAISWNLESEFIQTKQCVACLTAVGNNQVWAGSVGIYIIDMRTITCNRTLMDHTDLVVDILLYDNNRYAFTASLDCVILKWDVQTLTLAQTKIHLQNHIKNLRSLKIQGDKMFCAGSWSCILVCDLQGTVLQTFKDMDKDRVVELDSFSVLPDGKLWTGCRREGKINVWDIETGEKTDTIPVEGARGVGIMTYTDSKLWVGTKTGMIHIYNTEDMTVCKTLQAHEDAVRVLCDVTDRYMISGGGSKDGKVCIWSVSHEHTESGNFPESGDKTHL